MSAMFLVALAGGMAAAVLFVGAHLWLNARHPGSRARRWNSGVFALCQAVVVAGALLDWAYGPYLLSPVGLAFLGQPLLLVPSALAAALLAWNHLVPGGYAVLFAGAGVQVVSVIPILLVLEKRLTLSFLAHGTIVTLAASALSLFALVGNLVQDVGPPGSWRARVMLLRREQAYAALQAVAAAFGLRWLPPRSILELGSARGHVHGHAVVIDSAPRLWPPRYRVEVRVEGPAGPLPAGPVPAPWTVVEGPNGRVAFVESASDMPFDEASLRAILQLLTEASP